MDVDSHPTATSPTTMPPPLSASEPHDAKKPVVRGARACTVCRTAKMKCVGADDGKRPCERCRRQNLECIFEKHRRGRKPGSRLSEASKMLRRLEKGLHNAKAKGQAFEGNGPPPLPASQDPTIGASGSSSHRSPFQQNGAFPNNELPPLKLPSSSYGDSAHDPHYGSSDDEDNEDDADPGAAPAKLILKENQRRPYLTTILNPEHQSPTISSHSRSPAVTISGSSPGWPPLDSNTQPEAIPDPISEGLIDEASAKVLFDLVFLRLNPFICLFDPSLHSVAYVRSRSRFLFTTLIMAGCKFFRPELFRACQKMAHELAVRAFAENWKSVEVAQAFACLVYWKEPEDNRTWTYIGYACRMAIELGLNRYYAEPPARETELQLRERRNRERTYLVLFVHDRSLATSTGRSWMLPEDELVRNSIHWHERGGDIIQPEDVIISAFVQLRCITAESTEVFQMQKGSNEHSDLDRAVLLSNCNGKLTQWMVFWEHEMRRANGERFHMEFLKFFRLYVRLFLNSFGLQGSMNNTRTNPSVQALSMCYTSAIEHLQIVFQEFAKMNMLRYGQDSITLMTAYCAVFLLRLLRSSNTYGGLPEGAVDMIHSVISKTADAYEDAAAFSSACTAASYHARFLRSLVAQDVFNRRNNARTSGSSPGLPSPLTSPGYSRSGSYPSTQQQQQQQQPSLGTSQAYSVPAYGQPSYEAPQEHAVMSQTHVMQYGVPQPTHVEADQSGADGRYWDQMFRDIGFGGSVDAAAAGFYQAGAVGGASVAPSNAYAGYQYMPSDAVGYPS